METGGWIHGERGRSVGEIEGECLGRWGRLEISHEESDPFNTRWQRHQVGRDYTTQRATHAHRHHHLCSVCTGIPYNCSGPGRLITTRYPSRPIHPLAPRPNPST